MPNHSVEFNLIYFKVHLGPEPMRAWIVPVPYSPPSVGANTRTSSHYNPSSIVRAHITPCGRVIPLFPKYLLAEVSDGRDGLETCLSTGGDRRAIRLEESYDSTVH